VKKFAVVRLINKISVFAVLEVQRRKTRNFTIYPFLEQSEFFFSLSLLHGDNFFINAAAAVVVR
jgi:hypothetical protein